MFATLNIVSKRLIVMFVGSQFERKQQSVKL